MARPSSSAEFPEGAQPSPHMRRKLAGNYRWRSKFVALGGNPANSRTTTMKTTFTIGAAALLSLLALQPALAQDSSSASSAVSSASSAVSSAVSSEPSSAPSSEPSSAPSSEPEKDNYGSLISSLQTGAAVDLTTITDTTTVNFVTVS